MLLQLYITYTDRPTTLCRSTTASIFIQINILIKKVTGKTVRYEQIRISTLHSAPDVTNYIHVSQRLAHNQKTSAQPNNISVVGSETVGGGLWLLLGWGGVGRIIHDSRDTQRAGLRPQA